MLHTWFSEAVYTRLIMMVVVDAAKLVAETLVPKFSIALASAREAICIGISMTLNIFSSS